MTIETSGTIPALAVTAKAPKPSPRTATITMAANGATLQLVAERQADESARTYVITTDAAKKTERGMTHKHATFEAALAAIANSAAKAETLGWVRRVAGRGFATKPDAFTALPAAPKPKK
jgi:hypothetical protein